MQWNKAVGKKFNEKYNWGDNFDRERENVLPPRIAMIPTDTPFVFKRLQFSVRKRRGNHCKYVDLI